MIISSVFSLNVEFKQIDKATPFYSYTILNFSGTSYNEMNFNFKTHSILSTPDPKPKTLKSQIIFVKVVLYSIQIAYKFIRS